jgi:hypothetical protein
MVLFRRAADKAALVAHYFTGKDAEDQLKRFTNVQPQAEAVKDEVCLNLQIARKCQRRFQTGIYIELLLTNSQLVPY